MPAATRKYLAVTNWDDLQYHKKLVNPPWTRLHQSWLTNYEFSRLSLQQWGVFFGMHMLAARTGNRIPYDPAWIAKQFGKKSSPVSKVILNLISAGFLLEFEAEPYQKKNKDIGSNCNAATTLPEGEGRGRTDTDIPSTEHRQRTDNLPPDRVAPHSPGSNSEKFPSPTPNQRNGAVRSAADALNGKRQNGRDPRTFDQLKAAVLPVAQKLNCRNGEQLHKLAGQSLRMSPKQCATALNQLIQDGEL